MTDRPHRLLTTQHPLRTGGPAASTTHHSLLSTLCVLTDLVQPDAAGPSRAEVDIHVQQRLLALLR